jgi:hydroxycarboxylate dehydrogenase B
MTRMVDEIRVSQDKLRAAVRMLFASAGSNEREQRLVADHLVEANLRGHDSHGVGMIPAYITNFAAGEMKLNASPTVAVDTGALIVCDGGMGLGQSIAHDSVALAVERAKDKGSCILSLRNSHHIGRIGHWSEQCAAAGLVSLHFVNVISDPAVAPFGGRAARIGTNPVSIGVPRRGQEPVIVDFATSKLAVGKVRVAYNKGVPVPDGVLLDAAGEPTNDPAALFEDPRGTLLPFGDHKGWGLALACELLAGALSGGGTQHHPKRRQAIVNNMFSVVVSPDAVGTAETFFPQIDAFIEWARTPLPGREASVLIAGEPERRTRAERIRDGVPVDRTTWDQIGAAAETVGLARAALQDAAGLA